MTLLLFFEKVWWHLSLTPLLLHVLLTLGESWERKDSQRHRQFLLIEPRVKDSRYAIGNVPGPTSIGLAPMKSYSFLLAQLEFNCIFDKKLGSLDYLPSGLRQGRIRKQVGSIPLWEKGNYRYSIIRKRKESDFRVGLSQLKMTIHILTLPSQTFYHKCRVLQWTASFSQFDRVWDKIIEKSTMHFLLSKKMASPTERRLCLVGRILSLILSLLLLVA